MANPPVAKKESYEFEIHGVKFKDDYYWLRNKGTSEVEEFLNAENDYTNSIMAHTEPLQKALFVEMKGRIKETDESVPMKIGDYYYYHRTVEGKNYNIHCRKLKSLDAPEEVILDINVLAEGKKYTKVAALKISPDHTKMAYSVDFTGGETYDIRIVDLTTGEVIDTVSNATGWSGPEWTNDNNGIYYAELDDIHRPYTLTYHALGTDQSEDKRLFEESDKSFYVSIEKSKDKQFLFLDSSYSTAETSEIHFLDLEREGAGLQLFFPRTEGVQLTLEHHDRYFYLLVNNDGAINFKMMRTSDIDVSVDSWELLIGHQVEVRLTNIWAFKNYLMISKRQDGYANFMVYDVKTGETHDIEQPEKIYGLDLVQNPVFETDLFRYAFSSPITPRSVYDYNMASRKLVLKKIDEIKGHDPAGYITERRYVKVRDGTMVPISLAYSKKVQLDGTAPLYLYGYGSYGISLDPEFKSTRLSLLERGVIFAIAHVRGGGEFGKPWYYAGKLSNKMNTFTDFIDCAEYLISEGFTSTSRLCAGGGSAGGLLMGAILNLRPDLFHSVYAAVPFVDVINSMLDDSIPLTTFEYKEWGNPNLMEDFNWMYEYSPYDRVEAKNYPNILITAGYNDPRVQYWEPAKWVAKLRELKTDDNLLLLKTKMESGHSGASGRYDYMKELAFVFSFILETLDVTT
ncbi:MAG: S9 family peptidase [Candidatus Thorarchaeota archaeon]